MRIKVAGLLLGIVGCGASMLIAADLVLPPMGASLELEVAADGVQIYTCEAKDQKFEWIFKTPEATLFNEQGRQVGTHFGGPSWKLADGSSIVGEVVSKADAPEHGSIPWLLLRVKSREGNGKLAAIAFVRRSATKGGIAPSAGCDAAHAGEQARMRYSATYQFYAAGK